MKKLLLLSLILACESCSTTLPRTEQQVALDSQIEQAVRKIFHEEKNAFLDHVDVYSYNGNVSLGGVVFDSKEKDIAAIDAKKAPGVHEVKNTIQISGNGR